MIFKFWCSFILVFYVISYRSTLDQWRMWHVRAKFDIALKAIKPPPQNVFLSCNYCGKNICTAVDEQESEDTKILGSKDQTSENESSSFKVCLKLNCL